MASIRRISACRDVPRVYAANRPAVACGLIVFLQLTVFDVSSAPILKRSEERHHQFGARKTRMVNLVVYLAAGSSQPNSSVSGGSGGSGSDTASSGAGLSNQITTAIPEQTSKSAQVLRIRASKLHGGEQGDLHTAGEPFTKTNSRSRE